MSENLRVAVPVESGEGLAAVRSAHFGHAAAFAVVDVVDGAPVAVGLLPNPPHDHGGCMTTVNLLAANDVQAVSAAGMGRGPLNGLTNAGIAIHHDVDSATVGQAVAAIVEGRTVPFGSDHACRGHH
jgi:predicted Fe-Mo cluster-binding NifX family protein